MKKRMKFATAVFSGFMLVATTVTSLQGCSKSGDSATINVWTASGVEKIMRDLDYSSRYSEDTLEIKAFKNEEESGQIIISTDADVTYEISLNDLISEGGAVLSESAFSVYSEKYMNVTNPKESTAMGAGYYPDALLPYEKAMEYKENVVQAGRNQGIWITLKPSKEQQAGIYRGEFTVTVNGENRQVPVEVTVYDYTLTDEVHMKTLFSFPETEIGIAELNSSPELMQAYADFLTEKRISFAAPYTRVWNGNPESYFEYVEKQIDNPKCSQIPIPYTGGSTVVEVVTTGTQTYLALDENRGKEGNEKMSIATVEFSACQPVYEEFVYRSLRTGKNLLKKSVLCLNLIDEYDSSDAVTGLIKATYNLRRMEDLFQRLADMTDLLELSENGTVCNRYEVKFDAKNDNGGYGYYLAERATPAVYECAADNAEFDQLKAEIVESLRNIYSVATATKIDEFIYENQNFASFCPTIENIMPLISVHENYAEKSGNEIWTYTAVNPTSPYPTYHMDDVLLSARMLGTIMYENNIAGNLFWATMLSRICDGNDSQLSGQDYYDEPLRFTGANGDGFLIYPGRVYGIEGPVSSLRMEAIKDSVEDFDLLYELENYYYKKHGATDEGFDSIFEFITDGLYSGSRLNYDGNYIGRFYQAREITAALLEMAENAETVITGYKFEGGKAHFTVSATEEAKIVVNGETLTGVKTGDYVVYDVSVALNVAQNYFSLKSTLGNKTYGVELSLGGKTDIIQIGAVSEAMKVIPTQSGTVTLDEENGEIEARFEAAGVKSVLVDFDTTDFNIGSEYASITFSVYNDTGKKLSLSVEGATLESGVGVTQEAGVLNEGWNEITVNLSLFWGKTGSVLEYLSFKFNAQDGNAFDRSFTLRLKDFVLKGA